MIANQSRLHDTPIPASLTERQQLAAQALLDRAFLSGFRLVMMACVITTLTRGVVVLVLLRKGRNFANAATTSFEPGDIRGANFQAARSRCRCKTAACWGLMGTIAANAYPESPGR